VSALCSGDNERPSPCIPYKLSLAQEGRVKAALLDDP
jgi:hypothetical protein